MINMIDWTLERLRNMLVLTLLMRLMILFTEIGSKGLVPSWNLIISVRKVHVRAAGVMFGSFLMTSCWKLIGIFDYDLFLGSNDR
jgi:hypothetical protein